MRSVVQAGVLVSLTLHVVETVLRQFGLDPERDHAHRRAAGIGRQDGDRDPAALVDVDLVQNAEIFDGEDGHFRIGHARAGRAGGLGALGEIGRESAHQRASG